MADVPAIEGWVELELLGHRIHHGHLTIRHLTPEQGSPVVLQLTQPAILDQPAATHFYTPQAVYGIHPTTEERVVAHLEATTPRPSCQKPVKGDATNPCVLDRGHDGDCEGLPF